MRKVLGTLSRTQNRHKAGFRERECQGTWGGSLEMGASGLGIVGVATCPDPGTLSFHPVGPAHPLGTALPPAVSHAIQHSARRAHQELALCLQATWLVAIPDLRLCLLVCSCLLSLSEGWPPFPCPSAQAPAGSPSYDLLGDPQAAAVWKPHTPIGVTPPERRQLWELR